MFFEVSAVQRSELVGDDSSSLDKQMQDTSEKVS